MEKKKHNSRSDNELSLGKMINNTKENMQDAEISMEFAGPDERENLQEKNAHRRYSIAQMEEKRREERELARKKNSD